MPINLWALYAMMLKSRRFEEAVTQLWDEGLISGEMHLGTGEEAIIAGVVSQLQPGDAMALDHRASAALLMRGVDPVLILRELLGYSDGLCAGMGGHMHLFSREHLAASSGIVGSAGPTAAGFALAAQYLRPGTIAVAFFGEGAVNQGMMMESLNLASVLKLPVLFVCKDDNWSITTQSNQMTGGSLVERAHGLGVPALEVDGIDAAAVWEAAHGAIERARSGQGPTFLQARCVHFEAHFLGFQLTRIVRAPLREMAPITGPLIRSLLQPSSSSLRDRMAGVKSVTSSLLSTASDPRKDPGNDPILRMRATLHAEGARLQDLEDQIDEEIRKILASAQEEAQI